MLRLDLARSSSCQNKQDRARHWRHMSNVKISSDSDRAGSGYARVPSTVSRVSRCRHRRGVERVFGDRRMAELVRQARMAEAIELMRALWTGDKVSHRGTY